MGKGLRQLPSYITAIAAYKVPTARKPGTAEAYTEAMFCILREAYAQAGAAFAEARHGVVGQRRVVDIAAEGLEHLRQQGGITTLLTVSSTWKEKAISPMVKVQLKHVLQEALSNVRQHAAATSVEVSLAVEESCAQLRIEDDGGGFYISRVLPQLLHVSYPRHGLPIIRDRARAIGGTFQIGSSPGRGTRIVLRIPLTQR